MGSALSARRFAIVAGLLLLGCSASPQSPDAGVVVTGFTYNLDQDGGYSPYKGAKIRAIRDGGPISPESIRSDGDGHFVFRAGPGRPFILVFYAQKGEDRVPELQQLSGKDSAVNQAHVTLLTLDQYERLRPGALPLREKLNCMLLEVGEKPGLKELQDVLRELMEKAGRRDR